MRYSLMGMVAAILVLLSASATLALEYGLNQFVFQTRAETRDRLLDLSQQKSEALISVNQQLQGEVGKKKSEIETTQEAMDKLSSDLSKKLKELEETNKKLKIQQSQLSNSSDELNQLKQRGSDEPPLF